MPRRRGPPAPAPPPAPGRLHPTVWLFLGALVMSAPFALGPLSMTALRLLCLLVSLPLLAQVLAGRHGRVLASDWLAVAVLGWMTATLVRTEGAGAVQLVGSMGVEMLGGYLIARVHVRDHHAFLALARVLVGATALLLPFVAFEAVRGAAPIAVALSKLPLLEAIPRGNAEVRMGLHRAQASFLHPIHFGLYASVVFALAWTALAGQVSETRRVLGAAAVGLAGFLSLSSGGILAIAIQVALIGWTWVVPARLPRWWLLVGVAGLAYVAVDLLSNRAPLQVLMSYATFSPHNAWWRLAIFEAGMANVAANPLMGLGMGDWARPDWMHSASVDNYWLLLAMRHGVPGVVLTAAMWAALALPAALRPLDPEGAAGRARRAWTFSICGLSFTLATVHVWGDAHALVYFVLGAGAWVLRGEAPEAAPAAPAPVPRAGTRHTRFDPPSRPARA